MRYILESILLRVEGHAGLLLALCVAGIVVACLYPFNFIIPNHVAGASGNGVEFANPSIAYSADAVPKLEGVDRFTLSLRIMPRYAPFNRWIGQIIGSELNDDLCNFALRQRKKDLCLTLGRGFEDDPACRLVIRNIFRKPEYLWVDIVYDGSMLRSYVNGLERDSAVYDLPSRWAGSYPIVAGNSADLRYPWSGRLDTLALFSGVLPAEGRSGGWRAGMWGRPLLLYTGLDSGGAVIPDGGTGGAAALFVPEHSRPYRRVFLEPFQYFDPGDIIANIVGFIPLGFLVSILLRRSTLSTPVRLMLIVGCGLSLSLTMEILQAYLPTRNSGINDLVTNSVGMIPGYILWRVFYPTVSPKI